MPASAPFNQSVSYLQLNDGSLVFTKATGSRYSFRNRLGTSDKSEVVVYSPATNSFNEYALPLSGEWGGFTGLDLIAFPSKPPYYGWCCLFEFDGHDKLQEGALCYNANTSKLQRFEAVTESGNRWTGYSSGDYSFYATADTLWVAGERHRFTNTKRFTIISLTSYNIATMERNVALARNVTEPRNRTNRSVTSNPPCLRYQWITLFASVIALGALVVFLYRLDVPSSAVPACWILSLTISSFLSPVGAGVSLLALACACLYLLVGMRKTSPIWKYVSADMLIWASYTLQIAASWDFWSPSVSDPNFLHNGFMSILPFPLLSVLAATATNVLLNHPFFQILAVCSGSLSILSVPMVLLGPNFLLVPMLLFALSLGCFRAGQLLQLYRVHIIVNGRRFRQQCARLVSKEARDYMRPAQ